MPVIDNSSFKPPFFFSHYHLQTVYPAMFRRVSGVSYIRERIETPDSDFLDLDWMTQDSENLVIVCHGLEGNTSRHYIKGIIKIFYQNGWDGLAINFRGCSGVQNNLLKSYHSGETNDLDLVISHALDKSDYKSIVLVGYSLGGNVVLKYMGEQGGNLRPQIKRAVAFSVPCDLRGCSDELDKFHNKLYLNRFLRDLKDKLLAKKHLLDGKIDLDRALKAKNFLVFDDAVTAPVHGFEGVLDYYAKSNSLQFLANIQRPTLLLNAVNDGFLSETCYPYDIAKTNSNFYFEAPASGGHVGFVTFSKDGFYYSEKRAWQFASGAI